MCINFFAAQWILLFVRQAYHNFRTINENIRVSWGYDVQNFSGELQDQINDLLANEWDSIVVVPGITTHPPEAWVPRQIPVYRL